MLPWERLRESPPGSWVELAPLIGGVPTKPYLRFLVVEKEGAGTWLEIWISERAGSASLVYLLLVEARTDGGVTVRRVLSRTLGGPVQELPPESMDFTEGENGSPGRRASGTWTTGAYEAVLTPAGTLRALRSELRAGGEVVLRLWSTEAVPIFGLARMEYLSGHIGWEVHAFGEDGSPVIPDSFRKANPSTKPSTPSPD